MVLVWNDSKLKFYNIGLYYKPIMIVNDDSSIVNKLETSLIGDTGVVIYNRHMFIVQATGDKPHLVTLPL